MQISKWICHLKSKTTNTYGITVGKNFKLEKESETFALFHGERQRQLTFNGRIWLSWHYILGKFNSFSKRVSIYLFTWRLSMLNSPVVSNWLYLTKIIYMLVIKMLANQENCHFTVFHISVAPYTPRRIKLKRDAFIELSRYIQWVFSWSYMSGCSIRE